MVKSIVSFANLSDYKLTLKGKGEFRRVDCEGDDLLMETTGTSYGFRKEKTKRGDVKYTLPIVVPESTKEYLEKVSQMLGNEECSPVYETQSGEYMIYPRVKMNRGGLIMSYIHDENREKIHPEDLTGENMEARLILCIESVRVGAKAPGEKPRLQLTILQAEVNKKEMVFEDFFDTKTE